MKFLSKKIVYPLDEQKIEKKGNLKLSDYNSDGRNNKIKKLYNRKYKMLQITCSIIK